MKNIKARCTLVLVSLMLNQVITPSISWGNQVWLSDLSTCTPSSAFSKESKKGYWRTIDYEAKEVSGVLVSGSPEAPDLTLAMGLKGWHAIYVGLWNREQARIKLTDDPCFTRLRPQLAGSRGVTIEEVFFKYADLSGQDLVIAGDGRGPFYGGPAGSSLAYVRCEPLAKEQVEEIKHDRQRTDEQKRLIATNDGNCVVDVRTKEEIREYIEPYRYSDVGAIYWGILGDFCGYPTKIGTVDMPHGRHGGPASKGIEIIRQGINPLKTAIEYSHSIGLKFHLYQRMGGFGSIPAIKHGNVYRDEQFTSRFYKEHPEWKCVDKEGRALLRLSYAYPEVRQFAISILREAAEYGLDGVNLQFKRGAPFVMYEPPLLEGFKEQTGLDARELDEWDERWLRYRFRAMTQFIRDLRKELDQVGQKLGKRVEISATTFPGKDENLFFGLDPETWIKEKLVDALTPMGFSHTSGEVEMDYYVKLTKGTKCRLYPFHPLSGRGERRTAANCRAIALKFYQAGADGLVIWDEWDRSSALGLRRLGHVEELKQGVVKTPLKPRIIKLQSLGGCDLTHPAVPTNYKRIYKRGHPYWHLPL